MGMRWWVSGPARLRSTRRAASALVVCALVAGGLGGCVNTDKVAAAFDRAQIALAQNSTLWRGELDTLIAELKTLESDLVDDVDALLKESIAAARSSVLCVIDFIGFRVREQLAVLKAKYLGQPVPLVVPVVCQVEPDALDVAKVAREPIIRFSGYNLEHPFNPVVAILAAGSAPEPIPLSISGVTTYEATLNLGTTQLQPDTKIQLIWDGRPISTLDVYRVGAPACRTEPKVLPQISPFELVPMEVSGGDRDFFGNGPRMVGDVRLIDSDTFVAAQVTMTASEWDRGSNMPAGDKTVATGTRQVEIGRPDPGFVVSNILSATTDSFDYTDWPDGPDVAAGSGLVARYEFVGDVSGAEAGTVTKVSVQLGLVTIEQTQVEGCTPTPG